MKERNQPYFRCEYELAYAVGTGNAFIESTIQAAEQLGQKYKQTRSNVYRSTALLEAWLRGSFWQSALRPNTVFD